MCSQLRPPQGSAGSGLEFATITVAPVEEQVPSKTLTFDDCIQVDQPPWLSPLLLKLAAARAPESLLFQLTPREANAQWRKVCLSLRLDADRYQLRHAGASNDLLRQTRTRPEAEGRGRWKTPTSLRRYGKPNQIQKVLERIPPPLRAFADLAHTEVESVLRNSKQIPIPDLSRYPVVNVLR